MEQAGLKVLVIIGGGIAAYKSLELIRELARREISTRAVLTPAGARFITPLSVSALTGEKCYGDLFDFTDETEMGHIALSRSADFILVAPATADLMARAAAGQAGDLATAVLLATDRPVLYAPAMNVRMWEHPATRRNVATLKADGALFAGPVTGEMACGDTGPGRMAEVREIADALEAGLAARLSGPLSGKKILVTAGPTREPLDPVRYIANRSSGKQGYAIAAALRNLGAAVTLVSGPASVCVPAGMHVIHVANAREMMDACRKALPVDAAVCCAAVTDYRPSIETGHKIKKTRGGLTSIPLTENPDILGTLSGQGPDRPRLVVGFAAETDDILYNAEAKRKSKGCDWIVANDVSPGEDCPMGSENNAVTLITGEGDETWQAMPKTAVARRLAERIAVAL